MNKLDSPFGFSHEASYGALGIATDSKEILRFGELVSIQAMIEKLPLDKANAAHAHSAIQALGQTFINT